MSKKATKKQETRGRPAGRKFSGVFQVRIEPKLHEAALKKAERDGTTIASVVRQALLEWIGS